MKLNYYIYLNYRGLTQEQKHKIAEYAHSIRENKFKGISDNTIYLTYKHGIPFIYKTDNKESNEFNNPFEINTLTFKTENTDIPTYHIICIDEEIGEIDK